MSTALTWILAGALAGHFASHVAIVAGLALARSWARAVLALVVPPLAPWWAWEHGMRRRAVAWGATLAIYALAIAGA